MTVLRWVHTQGAHNGALPWRIGDVVFTPKDMSYAHRGIIDRVGEQKGATTVATADDKVAELISQKALGATDQVFKNQYGACRHAKTQASLTPSRLLSCPLI